MSQYDPQCVAFFDDLALRWDSMESMAQMPGRLDAGLAKMNVLPGERILDVGCGTGNVTMAALRALGPKGRVTAVDLSARMLEKAKGKINDSRVDWIQGALETAFPDPDTVFDRVFCFGVWPHIAAPRVAAQRIRQLLRNGGTLHIWHLLSRAAVNHIHSHASPVVHSHLLAPAEDTAGILTDAGFTVTECTDNDEYYLVSASVPGCGKT